MYPLDDTIVALATAPAGAMRAIVRVAGPSAIDFLAACFTADASDDVHRVELTEISAARAVTGGIFLSALNRRLPCQLLVWPDERSYTRTPLVEIHTVGSLPLADALLRTLCQHGARLAEPGEFTLRAFLGGRIDLTQAEAVLGVIDAGSRQELDVALRQMAGGLGGPLNRLRDDLLDLLAHLEAGLDFVEEDIEFIARDQLLRRLESGELQVATLAEQMSSRGESSQAIRAVLLGDANAGKSSLFNALAEREGAIVSDVPGTTRDWLTARIDLDGVPCDLIDTAGIDHTAENPIDAAAQLATAGQNLTAEIRIVCVDSSREPTRQTISLLSEVRPSTLTLVVLTKCDLPSAHIGIARLASDAIETSSQTGAGLDTLRGALRRRIAEDLPLESQVVAATAARCHESLRRAALSLAEARRAVANSAGEEIAAAEIRTALDELGQVVGAVYTDDILDRIFSRFCIGK